MAKGGSMLMLLRSRVPRQARTPPMKFISETIKKVNIWNAPLNFLREPKLWKVEIPRILHTSDCNSITSAIVHDCIIQITIPDRFQLHWFPSHLSIRLSRHAATFIIISPSALYQSKQQLCVQQSKKICYFKWNPLHLPLAPNLFIFGHFKAYHFLIWR